MTAGRREVVKRGEKMRSSCRKLTELREIKIIDNYISNQPASLLIEQGDTRVICAATWNLKVPFFAKEKKKGWISGEYSMLPYSTGKQRFYRERGRTDNRNIEIQRFVGRALRSTVKLKDIQEFNIIIDADVIQADGGTRCASVNGGMITLVKLLKHLVFDNKLFELPRIEPVAAVSMGIKDGEIFTDIDFKEDMSVDADLNIVSSGTGKIVEVTGFGEESMIPLDLFTKAVEIGVEKNIEILEKIRPELNI